MGKPLTSWEPSEPWLPFKEPPPRRQSLSYQTSQETCCRDVCVGFLACWQMCSQAKVKHCLMHSHADLRQSRLHTDHRNNLPQKWIWRLQPKYQCLQKQNLNGRQTKNLYNGHQISHQTPDLPHWFTSKISNTYHSINLSRVQSNLFQIPSATTNLNNKDHKSCQKPFRGASEPEIPLIASPTITYSSYHTKVQNFSSSGSLKNKGSTSPRSSAARVNAVLPTFSTYFECTMCINHVPTYLYQPSNLLYTNNLQACKWSRFGS